MVIRQETEKDYDEVYAVVKAAFERAEHSDGNEQDLVAALRKGGAFVPELSLVAQKDGRIVGHILLTKGGGAVA
ncbi:GNAT family N-acetyltransferase [Eubacterium callanderi]|uniref:GNAT family N-acetyltransferase n=1 Tax=Eubacterium callanderi TaxID=53442 RepID=UPI003F73A9C1